MSIKKQLFFSIITPISGIIDCYFIMKFKKKKLGKNKLRTLYHFTGPCQEKSVNSQELLIYLSFGKFWGFFLSLVLGFCQSTKLLAEIVTFSNF